jgi:hypothetical protein
MSGETVDRQGALLTGKTPRVLAFDEAARALEPDEVARTLEPAEVTRELGLLEVARPGDLAETARTLDFPEAMRAPVLSEDARVLGFTEAPRALDLSEAPRVLGFTEALRTLVLRGFRRVSALFMRLAQAMNGIVLYNRDAFRFKGVVMRLVYASSLLTVALSVVMGLQSISLLPAAAKSKAAAKGDTTTAASDSKKSKDLSVKITNLSSSVKLGGQATCSVQTDPNALCKITVTLKSGPAKSTGLGSMHADDKGVATWNWKVASNTSTGEWPVDVECSLKGAKGKASGKIKIEK